MKLSDVEQCKFGAEDLFNVMARLTDQQIDDLPFGAILLDSKGTILKFNAREGHIVGRKPKDMVGKNFFEIAPCTKTPMFHGRFTEGVASGKLNVLFEYVFDYKMDPTKVRVHMTKSMMGEGFWIFVQRV